MYSAQNKAMILCILVISSEILYDVSIMTILHNSTNQELFEKYLYHQSIYGQFLIQ